MKFRKETGSMAARVDDENIEEPQLKDKNILI